MDFHLHRWVGFSPESTWIAENFTRAPHFLTVDIPRTGLARIVAIASAVVSLGATVLIGRMSVACHTPFAISETQSAALIRLSAPVPHTWRAIHILAAGCRCSRGVAENLAARGPLAGLHEAAVLVGSDPEMAQLIAKAHIPSTSITPTQSSEEFHINGAPLLLILAPDDSVRYAGGYAADRGARTGYREAVIWRTVASGASYPALPIFGCAASQKARHAVDPLGLRSVF